MAARERLSDTEALMWSIERDPLLRAAFYTVTFLDRPPDFARFRRRMVHAAARIPRLRQRIDDGWWVDDSHFDVDYHVRHIALPSPGTRRQLLDDAARDYEHALDPARPLWQLTIVEGVDGDGAALLANLHHAVTDGVGGVRMSAMFVDVAREAPDEPTLDPGPRLEAPAPGVAQSVLRAVHEVLGTVWDPVGTLRAIATQLLVVDRARSPLWRGRRSLGRRFDTFQVDLEAAKEAAHRLGGTVNDLYVTGVVRGVGAFHRSRGVPVAELRMSMPISTRRDRSSGGNAFTPMRVLVPTEVGDPVDDFRAVRARIGTVKGGRAVSLAASLAGVLTRLPSPLIARLARSQIETVDFACSNVRGAPFDLYVAGAHVQANHAMGPTAGTACNVTLLSYGGSMGIGINSDTAAIDDPEALRDSIADGLAETIAAGSGRAGRSGTPSAFAREGSDVPRRAQAVARRARRRRHAPRKAPRHVSIAKRR
jgi:diacylglycerol O-acyltransferase